MKKFFTLTIIILLAQLSHAQGITAKSYIEQTQVGIKLGTAVGYVFPCKVEVGAFHQEPNKFLDNQELPYRFYEKKFTGMYLNLPLKHYDFIGFDLNVRTGVTNGENFAITPSLLGYFNPIPPVKLTMGMGTRMLRPTLQAGVTIKIGKFS
ncbi:MAG: hypothetical protein RIC30_07580 [Marinoscillum sp.]|uniref:hypothetical protein n=1 Tax=Marinoscillum sp. TaxID=2024838 RepID=UPI003303A05E